MTDVVVEEVVVEEMPVKAPKPKKPKAKVKAKPAKKAASKKAKGTKVEKKKIELDAYGLRKGSARSMAAAMYARKNGATLSEVKDKLGSIQLNVLKDLEADGFTIEIVKEASKGKRPANRYWLKPKK